MKTEQGIRTLSCSGPHQSLAPATAELRQTGCWLAKQRGTYVSCGFIRHACLQHKPQFSSKSLNASEEKGASRRAWGRCRSKHRRTHLHTGVNLFKPLNTCAAGSRAPAWQRPPGLTRESLGGRTPGCLPGLTLAEGDQALDQDFPPEDTGSVSQSQPSLCRRKISHASHFIATSVLIENLFQCY